MNNPENEPPIGDSNPHIEWSDSLPSLAEAHLDESGPRLGQRDPPRNAQWRVIEGRARGSAHRFGRPRNEEAYL
jgi:hypothetical protein